MENNINKHICHNTERRLERNMQSRLENERGLIERLFIEEGEQSADNGHSICNTCKNKCCNEHGGDVYVANIGRTCGRNMNFRESIWSGEHLQMTVMNIPRGECIGAEIHSDSDQYIRVERGSALIVWGNGENCMTNRAKIFVGDGAFIPAGTWHNVINVGRCALHLSSVYAPPHHPKCTVQHHK